MVALTDQCRTTNRRDCTAFAFRARLSQWAFNRSAHGGGRVLVELLDEVSSLDHTPVELLTESKFLVGSAVSPSTH